MQFDKVLVDASAVGGQAKVLVTKVSAETVEGFLDVLATKLKVDRKGLELGVDDDDFGWCSVADLTDVDTKKVVGATIRVLELPAQVRWQPEALTVGFDHRYGVSSGPADLWLAPGRRREDVFMAFTEAFLMDFLVDLRDG